MPPPNQKREGGRRDAQLIGSQRAQAGGHAGKDPGLLEEGQVSVTKADGSVG